MSPELQRMVLARSCPKILVRPTGAAGWNYRNSKGRALPCIDGDPLMDLNAMFAADEYAAANLMSADQMEQYGKELHKIHPDAVLLVSGYNPKDPIDWYDFAKLVTGLTAAQRAEAFLRTLGLWKE